MCSEMERILGVPIGHKGVIPGTVLRDSAEIVYFCDDGRTLLEQFKALASSYRSPRHAQRGGMTRYGCRLSLPDGTVFRAVGYHGDIEGWRQDIEEGAAEQKIALARIEADKLIISDGREFALSECTAEFY